MASLSTVRWLLKKKEKSGPDCVYIFLYFLGTLSGNEKEWFLHSHIGWPGWPFFGSNPRRTQGSVSHPLKPDPGRGDERWPTGMWGQLLLRGGHCVWDLLPKWCQRLARTCKADARSDWSGHVRLASGLQFKDRSETAAAATPWEMNQQQKCLLLWITSKSSLSLPSPYSR